MPMDGLTVGFAARELHMMLQGGRVDRITQPERDAVVLLIRAGNANRQLLLCASPNNARCHLTESRYTNPLEPPALCMLMRKQLLGARVTGVNQVGGDRVLCVELDTVNELGDHVCRRLILEMMGRHSNLMMLDENDRILEATRHVSEEMSRVRQIQPGLSYLPPPPQDRLDPFAFEPQALADRLARLSDQPLAQALSVSLQGLSRVAAAELACRVLPAGESNTNQPLETARRLRDLLLRLREAPDPRILVGPEGEIRDAFPFCYLSQDTSVQQTCTSLSQALDRCYGTRDAQDRLKQRGAAMVRTLRTHIDRCEKKLALQEEELASAERMEEYRAMGEAIQASLYQLKKGMAEVTLTDWSTGKARPITVPLDLRLTPVQNAQRYFKKYQKARSARETAAVQREKTLRELEYLEGMLLDVDKCVGESELEEIRQELVRTGYLKRITNRRQQRQLPQSRPYRYLSADGIEIWVGKNATQNDRLTLGAQPGEMWLHAKDMPGSHVIIRTEGQVPQQTLKQAALLAAWFSKGQRSSLVPIDYTLRKYVKKPAGSAPGKVIYTHHKTAYMTPEEADIRRIQLLEK